ncbi:extracellular matrix regulator RemB [Bacillus massiliglaciei]|uniref:extracellular matrix regulator RemB n=1 Tax=Bacillus massiliglaciei TaxID=1816693 RepID=UPI000DA5F352|nr:extracellular matrix/biofilm biosynthesis regulator RemA family protein [Bacillus massiliglaciei]
MYLHIGDDILVNTKEIIAILDKKLLLSSPIMDEYLQKKGDFISSLTKKSVKSIVVTEKQIYYSPFATATLNKRSQQQAVMIDE